MSIRTILCPCRGDMRERNALSSAFALAEAHDASLRLLHTSAEPLFAVALGLPDAVLGVNAAPVAIEAAERERIAEERACASDFAARHGMVLCVEGEPFAGSPGRKAVYRVRPGSLDASLPSESRSCDLIVMGYDNTTDGDLSDVFTSIFRSGRPVLLVPYRPGMVVSATGRPRTVMTAWDGSPACARAIHDALPVIATASAAPIVRIADDGQAEGGTGEADLLAYLASHGIVTRVDHVRREGRRTGEVLLEQANRMGADLIVMGAYGHGHFTEMLLGGATNHVLKHSHLPLLLAR